METIHQLLLMTKRFVFLLIFKESVDIVLLCHKVCSYMLVYMYSLDIIRCVYIDLDRHML